jgi:hypothetical protein
MLPGEGDIWNPLGLANEPSVAWLETFFFFVNDGTRKIS